MCEGKLKLETALLDATITNQSIYDLIHSKRKDKITNTISKSGLVLERGLLLIIRVWANI